METQAIEPQILVFPDIRISAHGVEGEGGDRDFFQSLDEKGLDRLTADKVEHIICTSALSAHI